MITLHDLDNAEFLEHYQVDMNLVAAKALQGKPQQSRWHLEFDCDGAPFVWEGAAESEAEAIALGRLAIYADGRYNQNARVAICLERHP